MRGNQIRIGRHRIGHFRFLLLAMVLMFALRPFLEDYARIGLLTDIFFSLVLIAGAYAFSHQGKIFYAALPIAFLALLLEGASYFVSSAPIEILKRLFFAIFLAYLLVLILSFIYRQRQVGEDLITGAVCAYFLIGILWAHVFYFLELVNAGSFTPAKTFPLDVGIFLYYSFVTLTTLGYGDMIPQTNPARSLAVLEAVTGQLYLAITIARLVGVHASQPRIKAG